MKTQLLVKLAITGALIVTAAYLLRGHDTLTGIALVLLFLIVISKAVFAIITRRGGGPGGDGYGPPGAPVPRPPSGRPPVLSAAAEAKREWA